MAREQNWGLLLVSIKMVVAALLVALLVSGCASRSSSQAHAPGSLTTTPRLTSASATPSSAETPSPTMPIGPLGATGCMPPSPIQPAVVAGPEIEGTSANASLWVLLFQPLTTGQDIKMAWRMTGSGRLHLVAIGSQGQQVRPDWGPEAHLSSNWNRPGDEWGAGFTFSVAGCWDMHATRDDTSGDVWLEIPG